MSVLIKDMNMPITCEFCWCLCSIFNIETEEPSFYCGITKEKMDIMTIGDPTVYKDGRLINCPLVEVKITTKKHKPILEFEEEFEEM